jgi:hypothetical protein
LNAIQALSQLSYGPSTNPCFQIPRRAWRLLDPAGPTGLEPATSGVTVRHSNRLSYGPLQFGLYPGVTLSGPTEAGNRTRTGDLNLGKVALYQLSYARAPQDSTLPRGIEPRSQP